MESLSSPQERRQSGKACTNTRAITLPWSRTAPPKILSESERQTRRFDASPSREERNMPRRGTERTMMSPQNVASPLCFHLVGNGGGESLISGEGCQGVRGGKTVIIKDGRGDSLQRRSILMGKQPNVNDPEAELLTRCSCSQFARPWL